MITKEQYDELITTINELEKEKAQMDDQILNLQNMCEDEVKRRCELSSKTEQLEKKLALCKEALHNFVCPYCYNFCKGSDRILSEAREEAKKLLEELIK